MADANDEIIDYSYDGYTIRQYNGRNASDEVRMLVTEADPKWEQA